MNTRRWKLINDTITVARGDDATLVFPVKLDSDGSAVDLTNGTAAYTATLAVRASKTSTVDAIAPITLTNAAMDVNGNITVNLTSTITSGIPVGDYVYELELVDNTSGAVYIETVNSGAFKVTSSIAGVGAPV